MKQTKQFLSLLLMAIVMMAMSPGKAWAQDEECEHEYNYVQVLGGGSHYQKCDKCNGYTDTEYCTFVDGICMFCEFECQHPEYTMEEESHTCISCGFSDFHEWNEGKCDICHRECSHPRFEQDVFDSHKCTTCGISADHVWDDMGHCFICDYVCQHEDNEVESTWNDGVCSNCGYKCQHEDISIVKISAPDIDYDDYVRYYENDEVIQDIEFEIECKTCGKHLTQGDSNIARVSQTNITDDNKPTCTEKGRYYFNAEITVYYSEDLPISSIQINEVFGNIIPLGHTSVTDEAVDATCTTAGLTAGSHCSVCGEVLVAQEEIPALSHTSVTDEAVDATCTTAGLTEGSHCSVCGEVLVAHEVIPALGHTSVTDEAVDATCTTAGLTEGSHCSVCDNVLVAREEIPALGHTPVTDEAVDATCTESGLTEGLHCEVCREVIEAQEEIPALGHEFSYEQILCADGYHRFVCTREGCDLQSEEKYAKMFGEYREVTGDANPTATIPMTKVGNKYYASLYTDFPYIFSGTADNNNVCKYTVESAADGVVTLGNIIDVPANCGVIFIKDEGSVAECTIEYAPHIYRYEETDASPLLTGSETDVTDPAANQYAFGLSDTGYLGFWHWAGMTIPAWKAYLDLGDEASDARGFRIVFDDETNGIQQLPADASAIEGSYDLMGHKVREVKGLGIVNGKKVFVNY